jgi:hypothetical protein
MGLLLDENSGLSTSSSRWVSAMPGDGVAELFAVGALAGMSILPGPSWDLLLLLGLPPLAAALFFAVDDMVWM